MNWPFSWLCYLYRPACGFLYFNFSNFIYIFIYYFGAHSPKFWLSISWLPQNIPYSSLSVINLVLFFAKRSGKLLKTPADPKHEIHIPTESCFFSEYNIRRIFNICGGSKSMTSCRVGFLHVWSKSAYERYLAFFFFLTLKSWFVFLNTLQLNIRCLNVLYCILHCCRNESRSYSY